ncbi:MAG: hypothetical protein WA101_02760 [Minisyncoccia bacterium]
MDKWTYTILNIIFFTPVIIIFVSYRNILLKRWKFILISGFLGIIYFFIVDILATNWKAWEYDYTKTLGINFSKSVFEELIWMVLVWVTISILIEIYLERKEQ